MPTLYRPVPCFRVNGVSTPGIGNIVASGITLPASELNWNGSSVGGAGIYPSNLVSQVTCGDGLTVGEVTDAGPCDIFSMDRNYKTPYVTTWTLGIQHAFSGKLSLDAAYVGNHGSRLTGIQDINQPAVGSVDGGPITAGMADVGAKQPRDLSPSTAKYPYLGFINHYSNIYGQITTVCNWHLRAAIGMAWTLLPAIPMLTQSTISPTIGISICLKTARIQPGRIREQRFRYPSSLHALSYVHHSRQEGLRPDARRLAAQRHPHAAERPTLAGLRHQQRLQWNRRTSRIVGTSIGSPANFQSGGQDTIPLCTNGAHDGCSYSSPGGPVYIISDRSTAAAGTNA